MLRKKRNLRMLGLALVINMLLFTGFLSKPAWTAASEKVRVGFFGLEGYHMIDSQGRRSGYGYDYLQYLARYVGFSYEYVGYEKSWAKMEDMLENGEIDLLTSSQKTEELLKRFDFSDQPIGSSASILTVKAGDNRYTNDDYSRLDGIRIGLLKGRSREEGLRRFAEKNGFSYETVCFEDSAGLAQALQSGEQIDAAFTDNLRKIKNEWILAKFDTEPFYVMVRKGNQRLLDEINEANRKAQSDNPTLSERLFEQYYAAESGNEIAYTKEEREYIRRRQERGKAIRVTINSGREPVSYFVEGEAKGIISEIARGVLRRTGLPYEFVATAPTVDARELLLREEASVRFDGISDFSDAERYGFRVTEPYLKLSLSCVTLKNLGSEPESVAVIRNSDVVEEYAERTFEEAEITRYDSAQECLNAVLEEKQDAALFQTYIAQRFVYGDVRNRLKEQLVPGYGLSFAVAVNQDDPLLFSILNKAVLSMDSGEIDRIIYAQTAYLSRDESLLSYLYDHPVLWITLLAATACFAIILILYLTRRRNVRLVQEKNQEMERFLSYVCKANDTVIEIDSANRMCRNYQVEEGKVRCLENRLEPQALQSLDFHPEDREGVLRLLREESLEQLVETGGELYFECRMRREGQKEPYRWLAFTLQGVPQDEKNSGSLMIFVKNIDRAKQEENEKRQALLDALASAIRAGEARGTFLSGMSHEIRTPLNAIIGYMTIAKSNPDNPARTVECLEKSEFAAHHLLEIINNVLDMSAIESGKMKIAQEKFNLRQILNGITSVFQSQAAEKGVDFQVSFDDLTRENLAGDPLRLKQVLMNLLSNAVKFTPSGGRVTLAVLQKAVVNGRVCLQFEVADTGVGMSEDYKKRLFQPFEQQDASTARKFGGTGLGLSITRNLVTMMEGTIDVKTKEGRGTIFTVNLSFDTAQASRESAEENPDFGLSGVRVLMAEDNIMNMEIAKEILKTYGLIIDGAENGKEALELFEQSEEGTYQAILMDIQMPVMNGYETAQRIRSGKHPQAKTIPIIALTADAFAEDINRALAAGMNDHTSKPVDFPQLCGMLSAYVTGRAHSAVQEKTAP